ncbi:MAG: DUF4293 domain-containing protein [Cyclobacteriaceae bacterium]|nr:DUF4293 domain-containing protein [Cyclobacteriaceae bacterium]
MIQRVQTLFLLGVIICMGLVVMFPIWEKTNAEAGVRYTLDAFYMLKYQRNEASVFVVTESKQLFFLAGLVAAICMVALYSIFQFRKRLTQIKLGALNAFLMMAYIAIATYYIYMGETEIGTDSKGEFMAGYFLPLAAMIFNSFANRFIKKDEQLVKSVDRIR